MVSSFSPIRTDLSVPLFMTCIISDDIIIHGRQIKMRAEIDTSDELWGSHTRSLLFIFAQLMVRGWGL